MTEDDAYRLAESFSSEVSPHDRYAFGRATMSRLQGFAAGCIVTFGDATKAIACIADAGTVIFLTFDEPMLYETSYPRLHDAVLVSSSRLLEAPSAFLEEYDVIHHPAFPGRSLKIDAIPLHGTSTEGAGKKVLTALLDP